MYTDAIVVSYCGQRKWNNDNLNGTLAKDYKTKRKKREEEKGLAIAVKNERKKKK